MMPTITCDEDKTYVDLSRTTDNRVCLAVRTDSGVKKVLLSLARWVSLLEVGGSLEESMRDSVDCRGK